MMQAILFFIKSLIGIEGIYASNRLEKPQLFILHGEAVTPSFFALGQKCQSFLYECAMAWCASSMIIKLKLKSLIRLLLEACVIVCMDATCIGFVGSRISFIVPANTPWSILYFDRLLEHCSISSLL